MSRVEKTRPGPRPNPTVRLIGRATGRDKRIRYQFTVPERIANELPKEQRYEPLLTEQGVLYRPVDPEPPVAVPDWVRRARDNGRGRAK